MVSDSYIALGSISFRHGRGQINSVKTLYTRYFGKLYWFKNSKANESHIHFT